MNKKTVFLILLLAISLVVFKYTWRNSVHHIMETPTIEKVSVPMLKDSVKQSEKVFQKKISELNRKNDSLSKQLKHLRLIIEQAAIKQRLLQKSVIEYISKDTSNNVTQHLQNCDSIKSKIKILITQNQLQDSLCELNQVVLQATCSNKDSIIEEHVRAYTKLKIAFNQSLKNEDYLTKDNQYLFKTAQRKTITNKILSAGLLVLSGITTAYFIQNHL